MLLKDGYEKAKAENKVRHVSEVLHTFEKEKVFLFCYLSRTEQASKKKSMPNYFVYHGLADEGAVCFFGGQAFDKMSGEKMLVGNVYAITFYGKKNLSEGRTMNVYVVDDIGGAKSLGFDIPEIQE